VRFSDLLLYVPLTLAIACVMGACGRRDPRDIVRATARCFGTLFLVVGCVGLTIRLLVLLFV
jgi:hypothetical protein